MRFEEQPERPTATQLQRLRAHVPGALSILRRLQTAAGAFDRPLTGTTSAGTSEWARVLFALEDGEDGEDGEDQVEHFVAAYVDLSKAPETQVWLYASDEDDDRPDGSHDGTAVPQVDRGAALAARWSAARQARIRALTLSVLRRIRTLAAAQAPRVPAVAAHCTARVKVNLHEGVRYLLVPVVVAETGTPAGTTTGVTTVYWDAYDRWLFRVADLPPAPAGVDGDEGQLAVRGLDRPLRWDVVRPGDIDLVMARTHIMRTADTLLLIPSAALRDGTTLVAWAFLGLDGSIWTLHCEEPYRGRGLAKVLAARLIRLHNGAFSIDTGVDDGWCLADVAATNPQSQAVCRSIGGRRYWSCAWTILNYDSFGADVAGEW